MKIEKQYNFTILEHFPGMIEYPGEQNESDEERKELDAFLSSLPPGGVWQYGEEKQEFVRCEITRLMGTCIDATYTVFEKGV
jgi:hypothetical protein